jgi:hypothetical protein
VGFAEERGGDPQDVQGGEAAGEPWRSWTSTSRDSDISEEDMEEMKAIDRNHRTNQPAKFWGVDIYA